MGRRVEAERAKRETKRGDRRRTGYAWLGETARNAPWQMAAVSRVSVEEGERQRQIGDGKSQFETDRASGNDRHRAERGRKEKDQRQIETRERKTVPLPD